MINRTRIFALIIVAGALTAQAFESDQAVKKAIQGRYQELSRAFAKKDIKFLDTYLAKDYVAYREQGVKVSRDQAINGFKVLMSMAKDMKWTRNIKSLTQKGPNAMMRVESDIVGKVLEADKAVHTLKIHSVADDIWVKNKKVWMLKQSKTLKQEMYIDGKKQ